MHRRAVCRRRYRRGSARARTHRQRPGRGDRPLRLRFLHAHHVSLVLLRGQIHEPLRQSTRARRAVELLPGARRLGRRLHGHRRPMEAPVRGHRASRAGWNPNLSISARAWPIAPRWTPPCSNGWAATPWRNASSACIPAKSPAAAPLFPAAELPDEPNLRHRRALVYSQDPLSGKQVVQSLGQPRTLQAARPPRRPPSLRRTKIMHCLPHCRAALRRISSIPPRLRGPRSRE